MSKRIQLRRGTTAQTNAFTGAIGEVTVDTDNKTLVVHDGTTVGGTPLVNKNQLVDGSLVKSFRALLSARLTQMSGTSSSSSNTSTITCTIIGHGLNVGDVISVSYAYKFDSNLVYALDTVAVTSVVDGDTFTFTSPQSGFTNISSAGCFLNYVIKNNYNINSLVINTVGRYTVSINTASGITTTNFIPFVQAVASDNSIVIVQPKAITSATSLTVETYNKTGTLISPQWLHIGVTQ